jgi:hypothetical protein
LWNIEYSTHDHFTIVIDKGGQRLRKFNRVPTGSRRFGFYQFLRFGTDAVINISCASNQAVSDEGCFEDWPNRKF